MAIAQAPDEPVAQLRATISAFVRGIEADPRPSPHRVRRARRQRRVGKRRRETVQRFTDLLIEADRRHFAPGVDETELRMSVLMGIGGFIELITAWLAGTIPGDADQIIDHATGVGAELASRYLAR